MESSSPLSALCAVVPNLTFCVLALCYNNTLAQETSLRSVASLRPIKQAPLSQSITTFSPPSPPSHTPPSLHFAPRSSLAAALIRGAGVHISSISLSPSPSLHYSSWPVCLTPCSLLFVLLQRKRAYLFYGFLVLLPISLSSSDFSSLPWSPTFSL